MISSKAKKEIVVYCIVKCIIENFDSSHCLLKPHMLTQSDDDHPEHINGNVQEIEGVPREAWPDVVDQPRCMSCGNRKWWRPTNVCSRCGQSFCVRCERYHDPCNEDASSHSSDSYFDSNSDDQNGAPAVINRSHGETAADSVSEDSHDGYYINTGKTSTTTATQTNTEVQFTIDMQMMAGPECTVGGGPHVRRNFRFQIDWNDVDRDRSAGSSTDRLRIHLNAVGDEHPDPAAGVFRDAENPGP